MQGEMVPDKPAISATKNDEEMQMTAISFCLEVSLKKAMANKQGVVRQGAGEIRE
jgi:hypothetical protein